MSLVRDSLDAVMTSLGASPAVATQIDRQRLRPLAKSVQTAVVVRVEGARVYEPMTLVGQVIAWDVQVAVECYARVSSSDAADEAVDNLVETVYARLMTDPTLSGAVQTLVPQGLQYDFDADGEQVVCATFLFVIRQISPNPATF